MSKADQYLRSRALTDLNEKCAREGRAPNIIELLENYESYLRETGESKPEVPEISFPETDPCVRFRSVTEDEDELPVYGDVVIYLGDIRRMAETRGSVPLKEPGTFITLADGSVYLSPEKIDTWINALETELRASVASIKLYRDRTK